MNISDKWHRVVCSNCKEGTMFFTKQVPEVGLRPVYEYAISHMFYPAQQHEVPTCDTCGVDWTQHPPYIEDVEVVRGECIEEVLNKIQEERDA